jgi:hypothetical protein
MSVLTAAHDTLTGAKGSRKMAVRKAVVEHWETFAAELEKLTVKYNQEFTTIKDQAQKYTNNCVELAKSGLVLVQRADENNKHLNSELVRLCTATRKMRQELDKKQARKGIPAKRPAKIAPQARKAGV